MNAKSSRAARRLLSVALLLTLAGTLPVGAQIVSGTIVGTVTDSTGAVVPGASVAAVNTATGLSRSSDSDPQGNFSLLQLPPGQYSLNASSEAFRSFEVTGITLLVEQTARVDVRLEIGEVAEQIEVVAAGAVVQSETSWVGQVIDRERIVELPLNGRNFMQLANLSPGTAPAYNRRSATITNQPGSPDDIRFVYPTQRLGLFNNGRFTFDGRYTGSSVGDFGLG